MEPKGNKSDGATHLAAPSRKRYLARGIEGYRGADLKNDLPGAKSEKGGREKPLRRLSTM